MKTNQKQEYSSPRMEIISIQNESLLGGASNTVEERNGLKDVSNKSFDTSFFYVVIFALLRIEVLLNVFVEAGERLLY